MTTLPLQVRRYGSDTPLPEQMLLHAGPLSLCFEAGDLRYVRLGEREIIRRIYVAVRDQNWNTIPAVLSQIQIETSEQAFQIRYTARHSADALDFSWTGTISGDAHGTIMFTMAGQAHSTFLRNRIGFCVLHPIYECAGMRCQVEHVDGTTVNTVFPVSIAPHQPFRAIRAIRHEVLPKTWAELQMSGDVFELEDQRNWTDASYKTYCTPLSLPFPVEVAVGTSVAQSVALILHGAVPASATTLAPLRLTRTEAPARPVPRIGLGMASHDQPLSETELARLRALNLAHIRVDIHLAQSNFGDRLHQASALARLLDVQLEVALFLTDNAHTELQALSVLLVQERMPIRQWLIFHEHEKVTAARWVELARTHLRDYATGAAFGSGTNAYFAEINRDRTPIEVADFVSYSINPQVHAFDNASLVETLAAQAATVASARQFCGGRPIVVSPVTLQPRFNPNATATALVQAADVLPPQVDVRQMALFGAAWTLGSLKYLAESGVASATYYETTGWRGVMETAVGSPLPALFRSLPGAVFPLYHVLADVGDFAGGTIIPTCTSDPLHVDGMTLLKEGRFRSLVANMSATARQVVIDHLPPVVTVRTLDEHSAASAMRTPEAFRVAVQPVHQTSDGVLLLDLLPYAVVCIDGLHEEPLS